MNIKDYGFSVRFSLLISIALLMLFGASNLVSAATLSQPTNLRHLVYSSTAAEISMCHSA